MGGGLGELSKKYASMSVKASIRHVNNVNVIMSIPQCIISEIPDTLSH